MDVAVPRGDHSRKAHKSIFMLSLNHQGTGWEARDPEPPTIEETGEEAANEDAPAEETANDDTAAAAEATVPEPEPEPEEVRQSAPLVRKSAGARTASTSIGGGFV